MSAAHAADASRATLRSRVRRQRRGLEDAARRAADQALVSNILALPQYARARAIAVYCAFDGEPALDEFVANACRRGKRVYAPVLSSAGMRFARWLPTTRMRRNTFGFAEPVNAIAIDARSLDLVLTPLVAFDRNGARLGFGGGYYDRCFAFLRARRAWFKPKLVGVGYAFQELAHIERQPWDVPLWGAVTDTGIHHFEQTGTR